MFPAIGPNPLSQAIAAFAGMMAFPLAVPTHDALSAVPVHAELVGEKQAVADTPSEDCLTTTICEVKSRVRWRTSPWRPAYCERIAHAVLTSSQRYNIPASLVLAVMINESDMDEKAIRTTVKAGRVYAKDGGLMGIRCIVDKQGRCVNGNVRGMPWNKVMDPVTNIDIGARELAYWRDGGGITNVTVRVRGSDGVLRTMQKHVPCTHKNHAYWAHYNHGPRYIDRGPARHYPHRIAVLYYALAQTMSVDTHDLTSMRLTVNDSGKRPRTADHPVEARYQKLCRSIREVGAGCSEVTTAQLHSDRLN